MAPRTPAGMARPNKKISPRRRRPPTTIRSLPFEILSVLFLLVRDTASSQVEWIRLAWVCSFWRQVALETHLLWTRLRLPRFDLSFVSDLLDRSEGLDLDLEVDITAYSADQALALVLHHARRIRSLSVTFHFEQTSAVQDALDAVKHRLETLALRASYDASPAGLEEEVVSHIVLRPLVFPALRNLSVTGLTFGAPQCLLSALISLELHDIKGDRFRRVAAEWVHDTLEACAPTLERLALIYIEYLYVHFYMVPQQPMPFPRLRKLKMRDNTQMIIQDFLSFALLPVTASLDLQNSWHNIHWLWDVPTSVFSDLMFPYFRHQREAAVPILFRNRALRIQAGKSFYLTGWANNAENTVWRATADLRDIPYFSSNSMFFPMMARLGRLINHDTLEEYECHFSAHLETFEAWPKAIGGFLNVRKFTFGATRAANELLEDFIAARSSFRHLEEMTLCLPEVAESTVKLLYEVKRVRMRFGNSVFPPILFLRLPRRLADCRKTRAHIARLKVDMARITRLEVRFLDCAFCHRLPKPRRLKTTGPGGDKTDSLKTGEPEPWWAESELMTPLP